MKSSHKIKLTKTSPKSLTRDDKKFKAQFDTDVKSKILFTLSVSYAFILNENNGLKRNGKWIRTPMTRFSSTLYPFDCQNKNSGKVVKSSKNPITKK